MSSEQARKENVTDEREIEVEKDRVPKMTTHFESLAEKTNGDQDVVKTPHHVERVAVPVRVGAVEYSTSMETAKEAESETRVSQKEEKKAPSLEEISRLRGAALQNSIEAIRAAEERYDKAAKETVTTKKAIEAKDVISSKGGALSEPAMEKARQAKDVIAPKAAAVKDTAVEKELQVLSKGQTAAQYAAEKAKVAKDTAVDTSMVAAQYAGEKAVAAKDVTGKVAGDVKDQAVVAGWGAAHYTLEKVAEATKTVAGYTGEKAVVAKDKVAGVGKTVVGYAGDTIAAVKDAVVASEEKAAEFAARKKAEAEKELEENKKSSHDETAGESGEVFPGKEEGETREFPGKEEGEMRERSGMGSEKVKEDSDEGAEWEHKEQEGGGRGEGGGVLQAIGETIVEIGQTTKDLLVGQYPVDAMERGHEPKDDQQPYAGVAEGI